MLNKIGLGILCAALLCAVGCTSVTLQSNANPASVHKVSHLFIVINQGEIKKQPLSTSLAADFKNCLSNAPVQLDIAITSPLDLDEDVYKTRIKESNADAVLVIAVQTYIIDEYGGYPTIMYDASLYDPDMKKRKWRAAINNSGGTGLLDRRMREMAEKIVAQLKLDGFL